MGHFMLTEITRGHVRIQVGERTVRVSGEMLIPTPGLPDFQIYRNSVRGWDPPFENEPIDAATSGHILNQIKLELEKMGRVVEFLD